MPSFHVGDLRDHTSSGSQKIIHPSLLKVGGLSLKQENVGARPTG